MSKRKVDLHAEVRRLADSDVGSVAWAQQLTQRIGGAAADDMGLLVVARAVLTRVVEERAVEVAKEKAAKEELDRQRREGRHRQALNGLRARRLEASRLIDQIQSGHARRRRTWRVVGMVAVIWLLAYAVWIIGTGAELDPTILLISGAGLGMVALVASGSITRQNDAQTQAWIRSRQLNVELAELQEENRDVLSQGEADELGPVDLSGAGEPARRRWRVLAVASAVLIGALVVSGWSAWQTSAAGTSFACAVTASGGVKCWGSNRVGQLGDGTTLSRPFAVSVLGLEDSVSTVTVGSHHACALTAAGRVFCWGGNDYGQLGDGTTISRDRPVEVMSLGTGVLSVAAADQHTCAVTDEGRVMCWGANDSGQLMRSPAEPSTVPIEVKVRDAKGKRLQHAVSVAAGGQHSCALFQSGAVQCWGRNTILTGANGATAIAAGATHSCALGKSGEASCWGENGFGQLGQSYSGDSRVPVPVGPLGGDTPFVSITASGYYTCATAAAGSIACWGLNDMSPKTTNDGRAQWLPELGDGVRQVVINGDYACAVRSDWTVACWGAQARFTTILNF